MLIRDRFLAHASSCLLLAGAISQLSPTLLAQSTILVPADFTTIEAAIAASTHGDTILVSPGIYKEDTLRPRGKQIIIRSTSGPAVTIIDSEYKGRCFRITDPITSAFVLDGFTLNAGRAPTGGGTIGDGGGGMLISNGSPTILNCTIKNCLADNGTSPSPAGVTGYRGGHGGGIYMVNAQPLIENCSFINNRTGRGGSASNGSKGSTGTVVSAPTNGTSGQTGGTGGHGGGMYIEDSTPVLVNCYFLNNTTAQGGTGGRGGNGGDQGGWAFGKSGDGGRGGHAGQGGEAGAIFSTGSGAPILVNCTIVVNKTVGSGFAGPGGSAGAGVNPGSAGGRGSVPAPPDFGGVFLPSGQVANCILWGNDNTELLAPNVEHSCVEGGFLGTGNLSMNPLLTGGSSAPGPEMNAGSPCIDAGSATYAINLPQLDVLGNPRLIDDAITPNAVVGTAVDIGASEYIASYVLPIGCGNPAGSLVQGAGQPTLGNSLTLTLSHPSAPGTTGGFGGTLFSARCGVIIGGVGDLSACGLPLAGGFLQIDLGQAYAWQRAASAWNGQSADVDIAIPNDPALLGMSLYVQGVIQPLRSKRGPTGLAVLTETLQLVVGL